ncbi:cGMP-specific 3',5'-cyclic phosphodiesterase [Nematolebias whitei]|uniref:cGMP-specific 3',5'-cyclic phosphodiesterase n=1 Tax=Nematolebias whitei TaxID=451745 RepID=UPI001898757A|nr:cGMP-specific 3',5'-cyclic phosphodiesterase [Nematolebias whitei]
MEELCSAETERMEAWLDDHLEFTRSYFVRKASREMVNAWFADRVHTVQPSVPKENSSQQRVHQPSMNLDPSDASVILPTALSLLENRSPSPATVSSPAPGTPTRKISASEFDRPLRPIVVKDSEGSLTFLSDTDRETVHLGGSVMGEGVLNDGGGNEGGCGSGGDCCTRLLALVKEVSSHLDVTALCHKIFLHINELIAADRYSLFLVGTTWIQYFVMTALTEVDTRFNAEVDQITGYKTHSILCLPIKNHRGEVIGVAQAINKKCGEDGAFTEQDEKDFSAYLAFSGIVLHNAQLYETSQLENRRNQVLLDLASLIFEEQQCLEVLLRRIAGTILSFMQAQACTIFIADDDSMNSFSSVFHMEYDELTEVLDAPKRDCDISQINYLYAHYVKNTMLPLNIADVTKDQRFTWMGENPGDTIYKIKSLLCTPIRNGKKDKVIGICQLVNKMDEACNSVKAFNRNDEQFLEAFAIFCGLGIQNTQMYETVERAMAKQEVTLEVLSYHATATEEESREIQVATVPSAQSLHLVDFSFSDFDLSDTETTLATIRMFVDLNLIQNFQMKYTNDLNNLEILALMIATLCHDLDHRGVNNSYIQRSDHPLAQLYCHSTMEHHHFDQCLMILNSPGNQILSNLSLDEYKVTLKMIERAILATDLALYIKRREEFFELTKNNQFVWEDEHHRELLRSMLMTACDISAITKPWPVQKRIAELVATEFFEQGDKERRELNIEPIDLMNREKRDKIPSMQVSFIDAICIQLYETLAGMSEYCSPLLEGCQKNRQHWKHLAEDCEKGLVNGLV